MMINAGGINCCATTGAYLTQRKVDDGRSPVGHETKEGHNGGSVSVLILPIPHSHHRFTLSCIGTGCRKPLMYVRMGIFSYIRMTVLLLHHRYWWRLSQHATAGVPWLLTYPFRSVQLPPWQFTSPNCCRSRNRPAPYAYCCEQG